jgi:hypothetical protein
LDYINNIKKGRHFSSNLRRKMIIKWLDEKRNSNTRILFICDVCGKEFERINKNHKKMLSKDFYDKDYCQSCWRKRLNNRQEYKEKMSIVIKKLHENNPEIREKMRQSMIGKNKGNNNGMKKLEAREKVSKSRKKMFIENPILKDEISKIVRKAWKFGRFEGVKKGRCMWYEYIDRNNIKYKVQGTWELKFIEWLDKNSYDFICHRKRFPYIIDGKEHSYYPDFFVKQWDSYVDVKARCWYKKEKFDAIEKSNPEIKLKILFKNDLSNLGVDI